MIHGNKIQIIYHKYQGLIEIKIGMMKIKYKELKIMKRI